MTEREERTMTVVDEDAITILSLERYEVDVVISHPGHLPIPDVTNTAEGTNVYKDMIRMTKELELPDPDSRAVGMGQADAQWAMSNHRDALELAEWIVLWLRRNRYQIAPKQYSEMSQEERVQNNSKCYVEVRHSIVDQYETSTGRSTDIFKGGWDQDD